MSGINYNLSCLPIQNTKILRIKFMKLLLKPGLMVLALVSALTSGLVSSVYADEAGIKQLKETLAKRLPPGAQVSVKETPIAGFYEVVSGKEIMYMTKDIGYFFDGDLIDMKTRENLTDTARDVIHLDLLNNLGEKNMLVYTPKDEVKHTITVFTDVDCYYCQKLHKEMADYMNNGVKVRYIFVPFKGQKSMATSVSVWCAKDRTKAMDIAKSGGMVEAKTCDNPINKHKMLATDLGIRGTPGIMLESGELIGGYVPSDKLLKMLNSVNTAKLN
ncbi:MAG: disulfide bond formation protein DsbC [endosymbiont of Galathealinum brachiosum]|uniref:Thiol:disulfide interchange protein n=1 Tax=endosymbiont of Galathealinum brachiosum TaxID=2200906 RepID=A0A370DIZ1_9GAMM|nr:MAG: disulfide bond formation protein DsbC [endosymbiont of Galathealinum brachiosum]